MNYYKFSSSLKNNQRIKSLGDQSHTSEGSNSEDLDYISESENDTVRPLTSARNVSCYQIASP